MMPNLADRLEDIPGVASVTVDLTEEGGGINIKLDPGVDESEVMERLRTVLVAYGVRSPRPELEEDQPEPSPAPLKLGVQITITPLESGARVEAESKSVRSFRMVAADPHSIAQGVADAWCQVVGRVPIEIVGVGVAEGGLLTVAAFDGVSETLGSANVDVGWKSALTLAVGRAIGMVPATQALETDAPTQTDPSIV